MAKNNTADKILESLEKQAQRKRVAASNKRVADELKQAFPIPASVKSEIKKAFSLDNEILKYMQKNTPGDALMQVVEYAKGPKLKAAPRKATAAVSEAKRAVEKESAKADKYSGEPRTIAEAKRMGKKYFINKQGKKLAAVTKEELEKSGMSLRDYLNKKSGKAAKGMYATKKNKGSMDYRKGGMLLGVNDRRKNK